MWLYYYKINEHFLNWTRVKLLWPLFLSFFPFSLNFPLGILSNLMLIQVKVTDTSTLSNPDIFTHPPSKAVRSLKHDFECTDREHKVVVKDIFFFFLHSLNNWVLLERDDFPTEYLQRWNTQPTLASFFTRIEVHFVLKRMSRVSILACLRINTWHKEGWVRWVSQPQGQDSALGKKKKSRAQVCAQEKRRETITPRGGLKFGGMKHIDVQWNKIELPACKEAESDPLEEEGRTLLAALNCFPSSTLHEYSISS